MSFENSGFTAVNNSPSESNNQQRSYNQGSNSNNGSSYNRGGNDRNYQGSYNRNNGGNFNRGNGNNYQRKPEPEGPVELYMPYVASGNRDMPSAILATIVEFIKQLDARGYTLRTGGREGPEDVYDKLPLIRKETHLPWKGFMDKDSKFTYTPESARILAAKFHPSFDGVKPVIQTFLATDVRLIMGKELRSPALFLITWSEDGAESTTEKTARTGNAAQFVSVASQLKIPIFNFGKPGAEARLQQYLGFKPNVQQEQAPQQPVAQQPIANNQGSNYEQRPSTGSNYY
jgi:hypothetical protein